MQRVPFPLGEGWVRENNVALLTISETGRNND